MLVASAAVVARAMKTNCYDFFIPIKFVLKLCPVYLCVDG